MIEQQRIQLAVIQHHINTPLLQKPGQLGGAFLHQLHMYLGITGGKTSNQSRQYPGSEKAAAAQHQPPGLQFSPVIDVIGKFIFHGHDFLYGLNIFFPALRQGQRLGAPVKERIPHLSLDPLDIGA